MFDAFTGTGLFEASLCFVALCVIVSAFARRRNSQETRTLQKENHRLRNIVATLMIDNAQIRDTR